MLTIAVLAGGLATRLGSLTADIPKSLLEVDGKPFAVHQLELLRNAGLSEVVFCVGHLGEQIEAALGDGATWGLRIRYSFDGPGLLGTGGALLRALPMLGSAFLLMYGDSYLECDYQAVERTFLRSGKGGLMTVVRNDSRWDRSNVEYSLGQILAYDKVHPNARMRHCDYGLGALRASALEKYDPERTHDLAAVYRDLLAEEQLTAHEVKGRFYEIGSLDGLEDLRRHLASRGKQR